MSAERKVRTAVVQDLKDSGYLDSGVMVLENSNGKYRYYTDESNVPETLKSSVISSNEWIDRFGEYEEEEEELSSDLQEIKELKKQVQIKQITEEAEKADSVNKFVDGDTLKVGKESKRFANIDTVETKPSNKFDKQQKLYNYSDEEVQVINKAIKRQQDKFKDRDIYKESEKEGTGKYGREIISHDEYETQAIEEGIASVYTSTKFITDKQAELVDKNYEALINKVGLFDITSPAREQMFIEALKSKKDKREKLRTIKSKDKDEQAFLNRVKDRKISGRKISDGTNGEYKTPTEYTYNQAAAMNVVRGIYDVANTLLGVESSEMEEVKDKIKERLEIESIGDRALADTTQYTATLIAQFPIFKAIQATKGGAKAVSKIVELMNSKNKKVAYGTIMAVGGLGNLTLEGLHGKVKNEVDALEEFALGAGLGLGGKFVVDVGRTFVDLFKKNVDSNVKKEKATGEPTNEPKETPTASKVQEEQPTASNVKPDTKDTEVKATKSTVDKKDDPDMYVYSKPDGEKVYVDKTEWDSIGDAYRKNKTGKATPEETKLAEKHTELIMSNPSMFRKKTTFKPNNVQPIKTKAEDKKPKYTQATLFKNVFSDDKNGFKLKTSNTIIDNKTDVKAAVKSIVGDKTSDELVNKMVKYVNLDSKEPFSVTVSKDSINKEALGTYTTKTNKGIEEIRVRQDQESQDRAARVLGHEIVHKISFKYMDDKAKNQVKAIMSHPKVKKYINRDDIKKQYKDNSEAEFLAEGLIGDDNLIKILKNTRVGNATLLSRVKDLVRRLFRKPKKEVLYDDLEEILVNMDRSKAVKQTDKPIAKVETEGKFDRPVEKVSKGLHRYASKKSKIYKNTYQGFMDLDFVKQTKIDWGIGSKSILSKINKLANMNHSVESISIQADNAIKAEFNRLLKGYSKERRETLGKAFVYSDVANTMNTKIGLDTIRRMLDGATDIDVEIARLEKRFSGKSLKAVESMAEFARTGKGSYDLMYNPLQIARKYKVDKDSAQTLATLYVLRSDGLVNDMLKLNRENKEAFDFSINAIRNNIEQSEKFLFTKKEEHKRMFGYSRDRYSEKNEFIVVEKSEAPEYTREKSKLKWQFGKNIGEDKVLLYRKDLTSEFRHGIIPAQKEMASGTNVFDLNIAKDMSQSEMLEMMRSKSIKPEDVFPVYDSSAVVINYRYIMNKADKKKFLGLDQTLDSLVANTAQSIIRKAGARKLNEYISGSLVTNISKGAKGIDMESPKSTFLSYSKNGLPDNISKEYRRLTKEEINTLPESLKKEKATFVRKDLSDIVVGYKEFFVSSEDNRALRYSEKIWKGMVTEFKQNILKYPVVLMNNFISNNGILLMNGVSPKNMVRYQNEALKYISELRKLEKERVLLTINRDVKGNEKRLAEVEELIKKNPLTEAQELGFLQSITEEVFVDGMKTDNLFRAEVAETFRNATKDAKTTKIFKKIADKRLNTDEGVEKFFNEVYMGEGSKGWKFVTQAMQYGDYMARWSLYKDKLEKGLSKEEAADMALRRFVDYRKNLPKAVQALSDYGFVPFATFAYRIQPELIRMANEEPAKVTTSLLMMALMGGATEDSIRTDSWNIYGSFMDVGAIQANPLSTNMVVPMPYEVIYDGLTNPIDLFKLIGFNLEG